MRSALRRIALGISAAALASAACAEVVGFETIRYEGAADAGDERSVIDGEVTPMDGGRADGEAGSEGGPTCTHDFCDDFEGVTMPDERWTAKELQGTGQLTLEKEDGGPNVAMRSMIAHPDGGPPSGHIARVSLQGPPTAKPDGTVPKVRVAFRVKVEEADVDPYAASLAFIVIGTPGGFEDLFGLELALDETDKSKLKVFLREAYVADAAYVFGGRPSSLSMPLGEWTLVEMQVNARPPGVSGGATITIGGQSDSYGFVSNTRPEKLRIDVGHGFGGGSGASFTSLIDDVAIDYK